jgi:Ca2+-binding RTX toxin-like protein
MARHPAPFSARVERRQRRERSNFAARTPLPQFSGILPMAFKSLGAGISGNLLDDPLFNFGLENDVVVVEAGSGDHVVDAAGTGGLSIYTGDGHDKIDTTHADAGSTQMIFAGSGNDEIQGGAAEDFLFDGTGNDKAALGAGDDTAFASFGDDRIDGGSGIDTIRFDRINADSHHQFTAEENTSGVRLDLAVTGSQNLGIFGTDTILNFENIIGSLASDVLAGNTGANVIRGNSGNDLLYGRAGNDNLIAGAGRDVLVGGLGADRLDVRETSPFSSDYERDTVRYTSVLDSGTTAGTRDTIIGFDKGGSATDDRIDLSAIDANARVAGNQAFQFIGAAAFTAGVAGQVQARTLPGTHDTIVSVDVNGDARADMTIRLASTTFLTAADFIL